MSGMMNIDEYRAKVSEDAKSKDKETEKVVEPVVEPEKEVTPVVEEPVVEPKVETPTEIDIEGFGKTTLAEIKKWKQDAEKTESYEKNITELQSTKQELADLKDSSKPEETDEKGKFKNPIKPVTDKINSLERTIAKMQVQVEIAELKGKYPDVDVVKVLEYAQGKDIPLEDAYKVVTATEKTNPIDEQALRAQLRKEVEKEYEEERKSTKTLIDGKQVKQVEPEAKPTLTPKEQKAMKAFGMTEQEYMDWK